MAAEFYPAAGIVDCKQALRNAMVAAGAVLGEAAAGAGEGVVQRASVGVRIASLRHFSLDQLGDFAGSGECGEGCFGLDEFHGSG